MPPLKIRKKPARRLKIRSPRSLPLTVATVILAVTLVFLAFRLIKATQVQAGWWPQGGNMWLKRKQLTLTNNSADSLASTTTVAVTVDTQSLVSANQLQSDCDDLRVLYSPSNSQHSELTRYLVFPSGTTCSTSPATKVYFTLQAAIASGSSSTDYYMYYANTGASTPSSTDNAFDISSKDALLVCPFNGSTTCAAGETPSTESGAIRYSGSKSAMSFDGQTNGNADKVLGGVSLSAGQPFTVEYWIYPRKFTSNDGVIRPFIFTSGNYMDLSNAGALSFTGSGLGCSSNSITLTTNTWAHVSLVYTGSAILLYKDGVSSGSNSCSTTVSLSDIQIGSQAGYYGLDGLIDEFRISDSARYTATFTPSTSPFVRDSNTKLLLHFDENGDDPRNTGKAIDDSGNGNHGTITGAKYVAGLVGVDASTSDTGYHSSQSYAGHEGIFIEEATTNKITNPSFENSTYDTNWHKITASAVSYWKLEEASGNRADSFGSETLTDNNTVTQATGKIGSAAQFTSANSEYLSHTDDASLSTGNIDFSFVAWVYPDTTPASNMGILSKTSSGNVWEHELLYRSTGKFALYMDAVTSGGGVLEASTFGAVSASTWYMVYGEHNSASDTMGISINAGTLDTKAIVGGVNDTNGAFAIGEGNSNLHLESWNGRIDQVGFWKRTLSAAERTALYNAGTGIDPTNLTVTQNTTAPYYKFGSSSAKLVVGSNAASDYLTDINPGNTNTNTLSAYIYNGTSGAVGGTVDATIAKLVWEGTAVTTTYTDTGGGWWRLSYSAATTNASKPYGVQVMAGKTIYLDGVQLEEKAYATTYADGTLGTGYAWTGTANDSTSSRTVEDLQYSTSSNISATAGTISVWTKVSSVINGSQDVFKIDFASGGNFIEIVIRGDSGCTQFYWGTTSNCSGVPTPTAGQWTNYVLTRSSSTATLYVNGTAYAGTASDTPALPSVFSLGATTTPNKHLDGSISDLRIYDSALTAAEVTDLYYSGLTAHSQGIVVDQFSETKGQNPAAVWHMDEGYGSTAYDSSAYGNNLTISGPTWEVAAGNKFSNRSRSLKFDGSNDYLSRTWDSDFSFGTGSFSIAGWFRHSSTISGTDTILARYSLAGYKIYMDSSGYLCFGTDDDSSWTPDDTACSTSSQGSYADSKWHHFQAVKSGTTSLTLYVDGAQVAQDSSLAGTGSLSAGTTLYLGIDSDGSSNPWDGFLDEVVIYPYARSAAQALADVSGPQASQLLGSSSNDPLTNGLVGYWKLEESSGTRSDSSGNGNTLTDDNSTSATAGKFGNGGQFTAASLNVMTIADNASLSLTGDLTLSAWIKPSAVTASTQFDIVGKWGSTNQSYLLAQYGDEIRLYIDSASNYVTTNSTNLSTGTWYHIVGFYNAKSQSARIFVNGAEQATTTTGTIPSSIGDDASVLAVGGEDTSSPYLYIKDGTAYKFISDFFAGRTNKKLEGPDHQDITGFIDPENKTVRLKITEELNEIAHVDQVYLRVDGNDDNIILPRLENPSTRNLLLDKDARYLHIDQGEAYLLDFNLPDKYSKLEFTSYGYYEKKTGGQPDTEYAARILAAPDKNTSWLKSFFIQNREYLDYPIVKRSAYSIHFQKPDGRIEALTTQTPIHFQNSRGLWEEIDTSIVNLNNPLFTLANLTNHTKTYLSPQLEKGKPTARFQSGDAWVEFNSIESLKVARPTADGNQTTTAYPGEKLKSQTVLDENHPNTALYPKVFSEDGDTIDIRYSLQESRIKEEIILNRFQGFPEISQKVSLNNVFAKKEGALVNFYHAQTGQFLWTIEPRMYELADESKINHGVDFNLECSDTKTAIENCKEIIITKLITDRGREWLSDPQRKYPVVIDPDFTDSTNDGYIYGTCGSCNYADAHDTAGASDTTSTTAAVGQDYNDSTTSYDVYRGFLKFDTSSIPDTATLTQVNLKMVATTDNSTAADFDVQIAKSNWASQDPITAGNRETAYDNCLADTLDNNVWRNTSGMSINTQYTSGNLSTTWPSKTGSTYYCLLSSRDRSGTEPAGVGVILEYISIATQDHATSSYRPVLAISYSTNFYDGVIDEVRVYNRALTPGEAEGLYNWTPGPLLRWQFDEGTGTSVSDSSGGTYTGTWSGTGSHWDNGKFGKAGAFNGTDDQVSTTPISSLSTAFTLEAWVKRTKSGWVTVYQSGTASDFWRFSIHPTNVVSFSEDATLDNLGNTVLSADTWYHVAIVKNGDTGTNLTIYINGSVDATASVSTVTTPSGSAYFGAYQGNSYWYGGSIDDFRLYNYARSSKQVVEDMNAGHPAVGSPIASPVGEWKFDESADNTCSGGSNDACNTGSGGATLDGAQTGMSVPPTSTSGWTSSGKFGNALVFDNVNDILSVSDSSLLEPQDFTVSLWFKTSLASTSQFFASKGTTDTDQGKNGYHLNIQSTNVVRGLVYTGTDTANAITGSTTISTNTWYHVTLVKNSATISLYLNGTKDATDVTAATATMDYTGNCQEFLLGSTKGLLAGCNWTTGLSGSIDQARVYNYALSPNEVKVEYNRSASQTLGALGTNSSYQPLAAAQEYCIPGDTSTCTPPVVEWKLDEGTGTLARDVAGGHTGTIYGSPAPAWSIGKFQKGLTLTGSGNNYIANTSTSGTALTQLTIGFWFKPTALSGTIGIFQWAEATSSGSPFILVAHNGSTLRYYVDFDYRETSQTLSTDTWYYAALTLNTSNLWSFYLDGNLLSTYQDDATHGGQSNGTGVYLGNGYNGYFTGVVDQLRIYDYTRTANQMKWDYRQGKPVGWWKFDECTGAPTYDNSGNANNGTATPGASGNTTVGTCSSGTSTEMWNNGTTGKRNASLDFDGLDDYVTVSDNAALDISGNLSVAAWLYLNTNRGESEILQKGTADDCENYGLVLDSSSRLTLISDASCSWSYAGTNSTVTTGAWHHIAATFDGTNVRYYIDGLLKDTVAWGGTGSTNNGALVIGGGPSQPASDYLDGQIDDVRIYNYTLSAQQIGSIMNDGAAVRFGPATGSP